MHRLLLVKGKLAFAASLGPLAQRRPRWLGIRACDARQDRQVFGAAAFKNQHGVWFAASSPASP